MKKNSFSVNGNIKVCAFCKYWYDPTNTAIFPKDTRIGAWEYDYEAKKLCIKTNRNCLGGAIACRDYECKIPR